MTLTQRLTRAGAAFIVFGAAAALLPTDGRAISATDGCSITSQSNSVGNSAHDPALTYNLSGGTLTLTAFPVGNYSFATVSAGSNGFTNARSGNTITTTKATSGGSETVTVTFTGSGLPDRTVTYTVNG